MKLLGGIRNSGIKENRYLYISAFCMLFYAFIELSDCIAIVLISFGWLPNIYLVMNLTFPNIALLLENQPYAFIPFFFAFTLLRVVSTIGLFKNREWGFWIWIVGLVLTILLSILFLPFGSIELLLCAILLCMMLIGKFKDKKLA